MEINEKTLTAPEMREVSPGFIMACVIGTEQIGGTKLYKFRKITAHNGARVIGDYEPTPRNPRVIKYKENHFLLLEDKNRGSEWLEKALKKKGGTPKG